MKKIFIIPGYTHNLKKNKEYQTVDKIFSSKGFEVKVVDIDWKNKTMSDYVRQFVQVYENEKTDENYCLGFSFGAMIALISAAKLKPRGLYLCSLSPYFREDIETTPKSYGQMLGKKRMKDFENFDFGLLAKNIKCKTTILCGEKEAIKFMSLANRCREAHEQIKNSILVEVPNANHDIGQQEYIDAVKTIVQSGVG